MLGFKKGYDIFLGGTTNGSKWRDEFIQLMKKAEPKIKSFNPVVDHWTQECIDLENFVKMHTKYHVYVITPLLTGYYSIAEMVDSAHDHSKKTLFFIKEEDIDRNGETVGWDAGPRNSLTVISNLLVQHGAINTVAMEDLVYKIVKDYNETPKPRYGLLK